MFSAELRLPWLKIVNRFKIVSIVRFCVVKVYLLARSGPKSVVLPHSGWTSGNVGANESLGRSHRRAFGQELDGTSLLTNPIMR